jgi:ABC-type amino acid transport system permease subunit
LSYRYTEPYTAAAMILLAVSLVAAVLVRRMEHRFKPPSAARRARPASR